MAGNSNSGNFRKDKPISDAIRIAMERMVKDPATKKMTKRSMMLGEKIAALAMKGDKWAMEQVADRIEGRPAQTVDNTVHYNPMDDLFGDILERSKARAVPGASETSH